MCCFNLGVLLYLVFVLLFCLFIISQASDCRAIADRETGVTPACLAKWSVAELSVHSMTRHLAREVLFSFWIWILFVF